MNDQLVRRPMSMLIVMIGTLWIALAGGCGLSFFVGSGLAFIRDEPARKPQHYAAGYDLMVLLSSIPVGAIGVGLGLIIVWAGLLGTAYRDGKWIRRALILTGGLWTVMGGLAMVAAIEDAIRSGALFNASIVWVWIVTAMVILGPGALMLWIGAANLRRSRRS